MFVNLSKICSNDRPTETKSSSYTTLHTESIQQFETGSNICGGVKYGGVSANSGNNNRLYGRSDRLAVEAGVHHHAAENITLSPNQCKIYRDGLKSTDSKNHVNVINLELNDVQIKTSADCLKLSQGRHSVKNRAQATQTLFRESSAQTLPYLPLISNDPTELDNLEIFKLPTILAGNGTPGLYEVEVLERARKRWKFGKAVKDNFRKQLNAAKEEAKLREHENIIEAFEWENWIEHEENIQESQMLRLELVMKMFDKRERDMDMASNTRIRKICQDIEAKRNASLKKNEMKYNRDVRCLNVKRKKQSGVWCKKSFTQELVDLQSEFYGPEMRYGINPNRRHYVALRNDFDVRMASLETKATLMNPDNLKCPFSKLRQWSKPKEVLQEVEQNFCSDANLNKLYDSLRTLRESSKKQKYMPLCLKTKESKKPDQIGLSTVLSQLPTDIGRSSGSAEVSELPISGEHQKPSQSEGCESFDELCQRKQAELLNLEKLVKEMRCEELETLISSYQGNTIGWLMRFLTEEICRLKEQRRLQFLTMLAKRKRWRREAAEAGLRQKENCVRETYEKIYNKCSEITEQTTQSFLDLMLKADIRDCVRQKAEEDTVILAKDLYKETSNWLKSFGDVQNPLNYCALRQALKDIVMPDEEKLLYRLEKAECIDYIINDVLMNKLHHDTESYDITFSFISDFVDRLIDNDIFLNSPDCSSDCECELPCACSRGQKEAKAIIRKVLRRAVPGRRWLTEDERVIWENVRDLLDDCCNEIVKESGIIEVDMKTHARTSCRGAHTDLISDNKDFRVEECFEPYLPAASKDTIKLNFFNPGSNLCADNITKSLNWGENLLLTDPDMLSHDDCVVKKDDYILPEAAPKLSVVHTIPSYHDLSSIKMFRKTPIFAQTSSEELLENMRSEHDEIREETSLLNEDSCMNVSFREQLESEQEQQEPEHLKTEINNVSSEGSFDEEQKTSQSAKKTQQFSNTVKEPSQEFSTLRTTQISGKSVVECVDVEAIQQEDDSSGFMRVSFTYDPQLNFSVAMPTNEDDYEVKH